MRILKYIFLLIILALIAVTVYVSTQKGQFNVTKSRVINSPRSVVYSYVNDLRNWENWNSWKIEDDQMKYMYAPLTFGVGGSYSWVGRDSDGKVTTTFANENDSISQTMVYNGSPSVVSWKFKDTVGGTKVTWTAKGHLDFTTKVLASMRGGAGSVFSNMFDKSLVNLDRTLDYEINTFSVKIHGITQKNEVMYLRQTINSTIANAPKNMQIMLVKMTNFVKKNKISTNGKPFVLFHTYDLDKKITKFSVCMPIRDEIYTSAGSDIISAKLPSFSAVKVTLTGDYSHRDDAWKKAAKYITDNNLERLSDFKSVEVITAGIPDSKSPSKFVTDIYVPIRSQTVATPAATPTPRTVPVKVAKPAVRADVPIETPPVIDADQ